MERITSRKNPKIRHFKQLGASKEYRKEHKEFLCDGVKLLEEAATNGMEITAVLYCGDMPPYTEKAACVIETERDIIEYVSPMKTPQDVLFTCKIRAAAESKNGAGRRIILEGVQDPGNVGTVMRTARAMGYDSVLLLPGCADLYSPKTVRATMGAIFRQPAFEISLDYISKLKDDGVRIFGAALTEDSRDIRNVTFDDFAVCIGSEGRGLTKELLDMCDEKIIIPMMQECESLNAAMAAGIIMWETVR